MIRAILILYFSTIVHPALMPVPSLTAGGQTPILAGQMTPGSTGQQAPRKITKADLLKMADEVNSRNDSTWKAGDNFKDMKNEDTVDTSQMMGTRMEGMPPPKVGDSGPTKICPNNKGLPTNFDAREKWKKCPSMSHIYDQGNCGSCWAVCVTSAFTDRLCIATNKTALRSIEDVLSCGGSNGCNGGYTQHAWNYAVNTGVVTGGDYDSNEGCQPYPIAPCNHGDSMNPNLHACGYRGLAKAPKCQKQCTNTKYKPGYNEDKVKAHSYHNITDGCAAQVELVEYGPIVAAFIIYEDFLMYKSGIYSPMTGMGMGWHSARVMGYGVLNNVSYWLCTNSWNKDWGDEGTFKVRRGTNEIQFEKFLSTCNATKTT